MEFMIANWQYFFAGFYVVEKIVKMTPTKYDDILLDIIWGGMKKLVGK